MQRRRRGGPARPGQISTSTVARLPSPRGILLPLSPIAPAIVVVVGITTAVLIAFLGIDQLQVTNDEAMSVRAQAISATLAARLKTAAAEDSAELLNRAARKSGAEILLVDQD